MDKSLTLCFQAGSYSEALQWYNYSLSLFKGGQMEPNLAKLQRNRASCFLKLKQLEKVRELEAAVVGNFKNTSIYMSLVTTEGVPGIFFFTVTACKYVFICIKNLNFCKAKEAIKEAQRCDPDNIFTQFSIYKVAVQENEAEKGT